MKTSSTEVVGIVLALFMDIHRFLEFIHLVSNLLDGLWIGVIL